MSKARFLWLLVPTAALLGCDEGAEAGASPPATSVNVIVNENGYTPASLKAPAGQPVRIVFTRTSDAGCGQQLVFPSMKIHRDLPLNKPVAVDVTMPKAGELTFTCGMDMYRGAIVAE